MTFDKKKFKEQEKILMKRAVEIEAKCIDSDPGSYEEYRDGYRFMTRLALYTFCVSMIFNVISTVSLFFVEPAKTYATTRDGRILEVYPIAQSFEEIKSIKSRYINEPNKLLERRDKINDFHNNNNKAAE